MRRGIPVSRYSLNSLSIALVVAVFVFFPAIASSSWVEVDEILRGAYGAQIAQECQDLYSTLDIPADQIKEVRESIARFVEAGYPARCPREYLRLAAELSKAGIELEDLTNKIREGLAKKVSPERLNVVIGNRAEALKKARILTLKLVEEGTEFLDRQMTYTILADYMLRGVQAEELRVSVLEGDLGKYPALENLIR